MRGIAPLGGGLMAAAAASVASGAVFFTFDDPATGREVSYDAGSGVLSYDTDVPLTLTVDATEDGAPAPYVFDNVFLTLSATIGAATPLSATTGFEAPASGTFTFSQLIVRGGGGDPVPTPILTGTFSDGGLVTIGTAGAFIGVDPGNTAYVAQNHLLDMLTVDGVGQLFGPSDASFTLTDISPTPPVVNGEFVSFTANAAYTGTANIPAPGAVALAGLAGLSVAGRRRR